jgi:hypothetical protein
MGSGSGDDDDGSANGGDQGESSGGEPTPRGDVPGVTADEVETEARRERMEKMPRRERKPHPGRERLPKNLPRAEKVIRCDYDESEQLDVELVYCNRNGL